MNFSTLAGDNGGAGPSLLLKGFFHINTIGRHLRDQRPPSRMHYLYLSADAQPFICQKGLLFVTIASIGPSRSKASHLHN